jgi:ribosomal protein S18 acetylase RimI-like enzyme
MAAMDRQSMPPEAGSVEIGTLREAELEEAAHLYLAAFPHMVRRWYEDPRKGFWLYRDWLKLAWHAGREGFLVARNSHGLAGYLLLREPGKGVGRAIFSSGMWREIGLHALTGKYGFPLRAVPRVFGVLRGRPLSPLEAAMADSPGIEILVIHGGRTGQGIGTLLLNRACEFSRGRYARMWLHAENDNPRAIGFYERHGFRIVASNKQHHLMQMDLTKQA